MALSDVSVQQIHTHQITGHVPFHQNTQILCGNEMDQHPVYTDLNLIVPHKYTQLQVSVHLTQMCHLLNHHINCKKNKN